MAFARGFRRCTKEAIRSAVSYTPRNGAFPTSTLCASASEMSSSSSSTMELDAYALTSKNQYAAHTHTRSLLQSSMERLAQRCQFEDQASCMDGTPRRRRRLVDLGAADGTSSMATLQFAVAALNQSIQSRSSIDEGPIPLHVTFEEHPASDERKLRSTLDSHNKWFERNDVARDVLMRSFYEPLFRPESVDFFMSYICLHWLDSATCEDIASWKGLGIDDNEQNLLLNFTQINETSAPDSAREHWRTNLAHRHLAKFLALRAKEMRPGAEAILVMVGHPHGFLAPDDGGPGPLTRAMTRCVERGDVREDVLRRTVIPYFLRDENDARAAFDMAADIEVPNDSIGVAASDTENSSHPGALLELIDCHSFQFKTKGTGADVIGDTFDLFWSIHSNSVVSSGALADELNIVKEETKRVFYELYDAEKGVSSTFVALVVRKRTRTKWEGSARCDGSESLT